MPGIVTLTDSQQNVMNAGTVRRVSLARIALDRLNRVGVGVITPAALATSFATPVCWNLSVTVLA